MSKKDDRQRATWEGIIILAIVVALIELFKLFLKNGEWQF